MNQYDDKFDNTAYSVTDFLPRKSSAAQTYYDYHGRLPYEDDAADYYRLPSYFTVVN